MNKRKSDGNIPLIDTRGSISGFSLTEIDKINEERLPRNLVFRDWRRKFPNTAVGLDPNDMADDLISKLPDEILCHIISFLTMREAATTSIISRRWRYIWRTSLGTSLDIGFDVINMIGYDPNKGQLIGIKESNLKQRMHRFVGWVNQMLQFHCGARIESFRVEYQLGEEYHNDIARWIQFAADREVEKLDLNLCSGKLSDVHKFFVFPHWHFAQAGRRSTLKYLSLNFCTLSLPPTLANFCLLKFLTIKNSRLTEVDVENILSNCLSLEWFSITSCFCPAHLKFSGGRSFLKLRHLSIRCFHIKEIEICGTISLVSFEYAGNKLTQLVVKNTAQLVRLCFGYVWGLSTEVTYALGGVTYALGGLAQDFPQIETLLLTSKHFEDDMIPKPLPTLTKLKQLVIMATGSLQENLLELTSAFLKASPFLHKLELHLSIFDKACMVPNSISGEAFYQHEHLKEVALYNFNGDRYEVEVAIYLIEHALALKKMKIVRKGWLYEGDGRWLKVDASQIRRKQVRRLFRKRISSPTQLVVV